MKKWIIISIIVIGVLSGAGLFAFSSFSSREAKISIQTNIPAKIYVNNKDEGQTSLDSQTQVNQFEKTLKPGEITLRLVPISQDQPLSPWDTKLTLVSGVTTVVTRDFGNTQYNSSGEVLSFEKIDSSQTEIVVVSVPDASQVTIDGEIKGFTPIKTSQINIGKHTLTVVHPGYKQRTIPENSANYDLVVEPGYRLTAVVDLAEDTEASQEASSSSPEASSSTEGARLLSDLTVQVLNGSGIPGEAGKVKLALDELGFKTVSTGNADKYGYQNTEVSLKSIVPTSVFDQIKAKLKDYNVIKGAENLKDSFSFDIKIIIGQKKN